MSDRDHLPHPHYDPNPRAHPGLRVIALLDLAKGVLGLLAGRGLELIGPIPLTPFTKFVQNVCRSLPTGVITPIPVTTTLRWLDI